MKKEYIVSENSMKNKTDKDRRMKNSQNEKLESSKSARYRVPTINNEMKI